MHLVGLVGYTMFLRRSALTSIDKVLLAALMQTAVFAPTLIVVLAAGGVNLHLLAWQWATLALSGGLLVGIQLSGILALKYLEASVWTIIFNLRLVLTTFFGFVVLGELPTPLQLAGGLVIFCSIVALNLHRQQRYRTRPVIIGLLATLVFSIHATVEKFNIVHIGFLQYMLVSGGIATIALWVWVLRRKVKISHLAANLDTQMAKLLVLRTLSAWGYVLALKYGSLAVTNYVSGMSVPLIVLSGAIFLRERDNLRDKITATLIAVAGLTLILLGRLLH